MERLPLEIAFDIFSRLPIEKIVECKSVSKYWLSILNGRNANYLANLHISRHLDSGTLSFIHLLDFRYGGMGAEELHITTYDNDHQLKANIIKLPVSYKYCDGPWKFGRRVAGSCNGLVCLTRTSGITFLKDAIGICNPFLKQYVTLPLSDKQLQLSFMIRRDIRLCSRREGGDPYTVIVGFGYLSCTDEYKVVRIDYHPNRRIGHVEVYTFGGGKTSITGGVWTSRGTIDYRLMSCSCVHMNGSLHWLGINGMLRRADPKYNQIVSFNLKAEAFRIIPIPIPPHLRPTNGRFTRLSDLGRGCLCFSDKQAHGMDIWVLKDYMDHESWVKEFSINWEGIESPYWHSPCAIKKKKKNSIDDADDHEILLWRDRRYDGIVSYDPKTRKFEHVGQEVYVNPGGIGSPKPVHHTNSLVSLKAFGEDPAAENTRKRKKMVESLWTKRKICKIMQSINVKAKAYEDQKGSSIFPNLKLRIRKKTGEVSWTRRLTIGCIILRRRAQRESERRDTLRAQEESERRDRLGAVRHYNGRWVWDYERLMNAAHIRHMQKLTKYYR